MVTWCVDIPAVTADHVTGFVVGIGLVAVFVVVVVVNLPGYLERSGFWEEDEDEYQGGE